MRDFALTADGTDIDFTGSKFRLIEGSERVAQNILIRLRAFQGEWFLDRFFGLPYFQSILVKNPDGGLIRSLIKAAILETADVTALTKFTAEVNDTTRKLSITFQCETTFGTVAGEV